MNLVEAVNSQRTKTQRDKIIKYVGADPSRFRELVDIFLKGPYRQTQNAGWPLSYCAQRHPGLLKPHLKRLLTNLKKKGQPDAVARNTFRMLQFLNIPAPLQALAVEVSLEYFYDAEQPVAVKVFAMTVLTNLCQSHPDLRHEVIPAIEDQLPFGSAGYRSRAGKLLKKLQALS